MCTFTVAQSQEPSGVGSLHGPASQGLFGVFSTSRAEVCQGDPSTKASGAGLWDEEFSPSSLKSVKICSVLVCIEHRDTSLP